MARSVTHSEASKNDEAVWLMSRDGKRRIRIWLTSNEAARRMRRSPGTLSNWRSAGNGPPYYLRRGRVFYDLADIDDWIASDGPRRSTSEGGDGCSAEDEEERARQ